MCNPSGDAVAAVSLGQFSLHLSADSAGPLGRVAQYTRWTPRNCTYRRKSSQRAARHPATSPDFTILCSVSSQHAWHADWINLWSLPSWEALSIMSLCCLLPTLQHHHHHTAVSIIKVQYLNLYNPMRPRRLFWHSSQFPAANSACTVAWQLVVSILSVSVTAISVTIPWSAVSVNSLLHWIFSSLSSGYADFPSIFCLFLYPLARSHETNSSK